MNSAFGRRVIDSGWGLIGLVALGCWLGLLLATSSALWAAEGQQHCVQTKCGHQLVAAGYEWVRAVDVSSGQEVMACRQRGTEEMSLVAENCPRCQAKAVYLLASAGKIRAIEAVGGQTRWQLEDSFSGLPQLSGELCLVVKSHQANELVWELAAYSLGDGSKQWTVVLPGRPSCWQVWQNSLYVAWEKPALGGQLGQQGLWQLALQRGTKLAEKALVGPSWEQFFTNGNSLVVLQEGPETWQLTAFSPDLARVAGRYALPSQFAVSECSQDSQYWYFADHKAGQLVCLKQNDGDLVRSIALPDDVEKWSAYNGIVFWHRSAESPGSTASAPSSQSTSASGGLQAFSLVENRPLWYLPLANDTSWELFEGLLYTCQISQTLWTKQEQVEVRQLSLDRGQVLFTTDKLTNKPLWMQVQGPNLLVATSAFYYVSNQAGIIRQLGFIPVFNWTKTNNLVGVLLLSVCIGYFTFRAHHQRLFIRRIAGLNAIDEAVGRATEMGKSVLYVPGVSDVDDTQTIASLSILGYVSRATAEYDTPILVPNCCSVVMSMAQEIVQDAYNSVGRPESFQRDQVCYLSGEQFGFAAGVGGIMVRERPAAMLYFGNFLAEALILAETGNAVGAIQIAASASASQLPFFVAACDYTLIGEELYAASAYLSKDPMQVGSLKGQDAAKALIMVLLALGAVLYSCDITWVNDLFVTR